MVAAATNSFFVPTIDFISPVMPMVRMTAFGTFLPPKNVGGIQIPKIVSSMIIHNQ
jgi:hypothetical protein